MWAKREVRMSIGVFSLTLWDSTPRPSKGFGPEAW